MKRKIKTFLPIFNGFYENWHWEPDLEYEAQYLEEQYSYKDRELWMKFDYQKWNQHVSKELCEVVQELMSEWITKIHYEKLQSPREYNFYTDAIYCTITVKPKAIREYIYNNKEKFAEYLKENYTSRDGFISWYSNDFSDWEATTGGFYDLNHEHELGAILQFIAKNEGIDEDWCYDRMRDSNQLDCAEFFEKGFWSKVMNWGPAEFVRQNYMKDNLLNLLFENFDNEKWDLEAVMYKTFKEIESHTLELKFK